MSEPQSYRVIETFAAEFSRRNRVDDGLRSRYRELIQGFLDARPDRELTRLDASDIEQYVSSLAAFGERRERLDEARMVARAFVQFVASGGLARARVDEAPPPDEFLSPAALADMREDVTRLWSIDGLAYALAVTAPLVFQLLGGILGLIGLAVHYAGLAGTYFMILAWVAEGRTGLPQSASDDLIKNLWRGAMVTFVGVVPPLLINIYLDMWGVGGGWLWAATLAGGLVGASLVPAASIAVYSSNSGLAAAAPHLWFQIIKQSPRSYANVALVCVMLAAVLTLWRVVVGVVLGWLPGLAMLVYSPLACGIVFALATILGGVIHRSRLAEKL